MQKRRPTSRLSIDLIAQCAEIRAKDGFVPLELLFSDLPDNADAKDATQHAVALARMFNGSFETLRRVNAAAQAGDDAAANLAAWMSLQGISATPCTAIPRQRAHTLEAELLADPTGYLDLADRPYPYSVNDQHWGFDPSWINDLLQRGRSRFDRFAQERQDDVAILVGNGPSLRKTDLSLLEGRDVFISNYAVRHPVLSVVARGVAVSNYFVAEQAPEAFHQLSKWRVLPVGLSHVLEDDPATIWLNALGGPLFFSHTPKTHIAWHATVTYFWLQVLLAAGYRRVLLIGVDNSYKQPASVKEGTLLSQTEEDRNHFDPGYFRGKLWQAADTDHMARTYAAAKAAFYERGGEIINCTVGGALETFPRSNLAQELTSPRRRSQT